MTPSAATPLATVETLGAAARAAFDQLLDPVGVYSAVRDAAGRIVDFRIEYVNDAACRANQLSREDQVGRTLLEILPTHQDGPLMAAYARVVDGGAPFAADGFEFAGSWGGHAFRRWFDIRATRVGDGFVSTWRDVTSARERDDALAAAAAELARREEAERLLRAAVDRLGRLADDERRSREEAQRAEEVQRLLMGIVSHDLRSPLQTVALSVRLLVETGGLNERQRDVVIRLRRGADAMAAIIRDLVDYSRARQGELLAVAREPLDLDEVCRRWVSDEAEARPGTPLWFESSGRCAGAWDRSRVQQVLANLLRNAFEHGSRGGAVRVRLAQEGGEAVLSVVNDGEPIPPEELERIFEPRTRGGRGAGAGLGLGLFIVREIARAHGGSVRVASDAAQGTRFEVRLPGVNVGVIPR